MAEHWLYFPSIGVFLVMSDLLCRLYSLPRGRTLAVGSAVLLVVLYSFQTIRQNNYWKEPKAFYERTICYSPLSARLHYDLASLYEESGGTEEAIHHYQEAIRLQPDHAEALNNLAVVYYEKGRTEEAITLHEKAM